MKKLYIFFATLIVAGAATSVSAQNACSQDLGRDLITMSVVNQTNSPIIVNWVDRQCKEQNSPDRTAASKTFFGGTYHGHVFRVREAGTNKLLKEFVVSPNEKTITISSLAAAPAPASSWPMGSQPAAGNVNAEEKLKKVLIGTWVRAKDKLVFDDGNFSFYASGKLEFSGPYTVLDEQTIVYKNNAGLERRRIFTFRSNNAYMTSTNPDNNESFEYKRTAGTKKAARRTK